MGPTDGINRCRHAAFGVRLLYIFVLLAWPLVASLAVLLLPLGTWILGALNCILAFVLVRTALRRQDRRLVYGLGYACALAWLSGWLCLVHDLPDEATRARQRHWDKLATPLPQLGAVVRRSGGLRDGAWMVLSFDSSVDDARLAQWVPHLARLRVECLNLNGTRVSDRGVRLLQNIPSLRLLYLEGTDVSDKVMGDLARLPNLEVLDLSATNITDSGLQDLVASKRLRDLYVSGTKVTQNGIADFQRRMPSTTLYFLNRSSLPD